MAYKAFFSLDSVKVIRTDGEDGEYSFRVYYKNNLYSIVNTPDNVEDGSEWRPNAVAYQIGPFGDNENFKLKLEATEYDGGLHFGDGHATIEKQFSINDNGLHKVYMKDDEDNEVEFRITISIQYTDGGFGGIQPPLNTQSNLLGVMLYEDWHYNKEVVQQLNVFDRVRSQRFDVGEYDLPYEPSFSTGGRWGTIGRVFGVRPNTISSLKIGTGYYIELCDEFIGNNGNKITISENTPEIQSSWNDKVKSISIKKRQPF